MRCFIDIWGIQRTLMILSGLLYFLKSLCFLQNKQPWRKARHALEETMSSLPSTPTLPITGFLRLAQILKYYPIGKTKWFEGVRAGVHPSPIRLGRCAVYRASDIAALFEHIASQGKPYEPQLKP